MNTYHDIIIRPLSTKDIPALYDMTSQVGPGFTSLAQNKVLIKEKLERVEASFNNTIANERKLFLFGMELVSDKKLIGISGVKVCTGYQLPFYNYKICHIVQRSPSLNKLFNHAVLHLVNDYQYNAELCSLFLMPAYRKAYRGVLLSRMRFLFIANYLKYFPEYTIGEMRGVCDENGKSPFWDSLIRPFFHMEFSEADYLTTAQNKQFIADLMPKTPIYVNLLSPEAQAVIGKAHPETQPAVNFLLREQFNYRDYIDIFDGGPVLEAKTACIDSVKHSGVYKIAHIKKSLSHSPQLAIACTTPPDDQQFQFLAALGEVEMHDSSISIHTETAAQLKVGTGDTLRICPLHRHIGGASQTHANANAQFQEVSLHH